MPRFHNVMHTVEKYASLVGVVRHRKITSVANSTVDSGPFSNTLHDRKLRNVRHAKRRAKSHSNVTVRHCLVFGFETCMNINDLLNGWRLPSYALEPSDDRHVIVVFRVFVSFFFFHSSSQIIHLRSSSSSVFAMISLSYLLFSSW
jgi:hypothetical protein